MPHSLIPQTILALAFEQTGPLSLSVSWLGEFLSRKVQNRILALKSRSRAKKHASRANLFLRHLAPHKIKVRIKLLDPGDGSKQTHLYHLDDHHPKLSSYTDEAAC